MTPASTAALGAPAAAHMIVTFATAVAAGFTIDGSASMAACADVSSTTCAMWIVQLGSPADGTHTLAVSVPGQAMRSRTFTLVDVKDGCGAQVAQQDHISLGRRGARRSPRDCAQAHDAASGSLMFLTPNWHRLS